MASSNRRVAHAIQSVAGRAGGPPVSTSRLAAARAARGHHVILLTQDPDATDAVTRNLTQLDIRKIPRPGMIELISRGPSRQMITDALQGCDIVYLHGVWDPILLAVAAEARRANIPYVVVPVGMLDPWSLSQKKWKKRLALTLGVRSMLNRAAAIRALNQDESDLLAPLKLRTPIRVIPNGMNLAEVDTSAGPQPFHALVPALGGRPYILFLSRLHYKKGLDLLAEAFAIVAPKHPDIQLVVAGPDEGAREQFEQSIAHHQLTNRVHLSGPLYGAAKWAALAGTACFCLPSRQEGFSIAILEALASRVPVVISHDCHFPEVAQAGAGVVVSLDPPEIAAGLHRVLADAVAANAMANAGRKLVEDRYTWDQVAAICEELDRDIHAGTVRS